MRFPSRVYAFIASATMLFVCGLAQASPAFEDYRASALHRGQPRPANFSTNGAAKQLPELWRYSIRREAAAGPNFASSYRLVEVSCGLGCREAFVVDLKTGRIFHLGVPATNFFTWRPDSRLIVMNADPALKLPARYFVFELGSFREVR